MAKIIDCINCGEAYFYTDEHKCPTPPAGEITCRGCFRLGTACGTCWKCRKEMAETYAEKFGNPPAAEPISTDELINTLRIAREELNGIERHQIADRLQSQQQSMEKVIKIKQRLGEYDLYHSPKCNFSSHTSKDCTCPTKFIIKELDEALKELEQNK